MHLRETIRHILGPHPTPAESSAYIDLALRIAHTHLRRRIAAGSVRTNLFGLSTDDLAIDCIAPLFARDPGGRFHRLDVYYTHAAWTTLTDADLLAVTRRLVLSAVHHQLVHLYREHDPSLEKIIRNLRNAIQGCGALEEVRRGGDLWVRCRMETNAQRALPEIPWAFLEGELTGVLQERTPLRTVVAEIGRVLETQTLYRKSFALTSLALLLRMVYARFGAGCEAIADGDEAALGQDEADRIIRVTLAELAAEKHHGYVGKGKVDAGTWAAYMAAVRSILHAEFVRDEGGADSYHEHLTAHLPGLSVAAYREHHRIHLEYLAKLGRQRFLAVMRKELTGAAG